MITCGNDVPWIRMSTMAKMAIDMRQPHVSNVENGGYGPFVLSGDSRPICLIWLSATIRLPLIPMTLLANWGLRRYILRQSRTGVKFLVLTRSSLNTAIWLLKMIEFLTCGSHMSAMTKMAIDMRQCKYVIWGVETGNWGDGHLGKMITCGNDVPWMEYVDE